MKEYSIVEVTEATLEELIRNWSEPLRLDTMG